MSNKTNLDSHLDAIQMAEATGDPEVNSPLVLMLASIGTSLAIIADYFEAK